MNKSIQISLSMLLLTCSINVAFAIDNPCVLNPSRVGCPAWCGYTPNLPAASTFKAMVNALNQAVDQCVGYPQWQTWLRGAVKTCQNASSSPSGLESFTQLLQGNLENSLHEANNYSANQRNCIIYYRNLSVKTPPSI